MMMTTFLMMTGHGTRTESQVCHDHVKCKGLFVAKTQSNLQVSLQIGVFLGLLILTDFLFLSLGKKNKKDRVRYQED